MCVRASVGERWRSRTGGLVTIVDENDIGPIGEVDGRTVQYHKNGHVHEDADLRPMPDDLLQNVD